MLDTDAALAPAACAATSARRRSDATADVASALDVAAGAARCGVCVPLPVALDLCTVLKSQRSLIAIPERDGTSDRPDRVRAYDAWLAGFCSRVPRRYGDGAWREFAMDALRSVPTVVYEWNRLCHEAKDAVKVTPPGSPIEWERTCTEIRLNRLDAMVGAWSAGRSVGVSDWAWCPPRIPPETLAEPTDVLWTLASARRASVDSVDWFDAGAARLYLESKDARLLPDQERLLSSPRRTMPRSQPTPHADSREEPNPYVGEPPLVVVLPEDIDEVDSRLVNGTFVRIGPLPRARPPETIHAHIWWMLGPAALERGYDLVRADDFLILGAQGVPTEFRRGTEGSATGASVLQATVLLVLDDWRLFMHDRLPVRFRAASAEPEQRETEYVRTGTRWNKQLRAQTGHPPREVVRALLRRYSYLDVVRRAPGKREEHQAGAADYACLWVLEPDLADLTSEEATDPDGRLSRPWPRSVQFPPMVRHVYSLDPARAVGRAYQVVRHASGDVSLSPIAGRRHGDDKFVPFSLVRHTAVDLFLAHVLAAAGARGCSA